MNRTRNATPAAALEPSQQDRYELIQASSNGHDFVLVGNLRRAAEAIGIQDNTVSREQLEYALAAVSTGLLTDTQFYDLHQLIHRSAIRAITGPDTALNPKPIGEVVRAQMEQGGSDPVDQARAGFEFVKIAAGTEPWRSYGFDGGTWARAYREALEDTPGVTLFLLDVRRAQKSIALNQEIDAFLSGANSPMTDTETDLVLASLERWLEPRPVPAIWGVIQSPEIRLGERQSEILAAMIPRLEPTERAHVFMSGLAYKLPEHEKVRGVASSWFYQINSKAVAHVSV